MRQKQSEILCKILNYFIFEDNLMKGLLDMTIDELESRLDNEFSDIYKCVLIKGEWGIGKTYFLRKKYLCDKKHIYVSLFGLNSIEEVKIEIYSKLNRVLNFIKKGVNRIKDLSINFPFTSISIPYLENDIEKAIEKKCKKEKFIIVIDDLERKSSNIKMEAILGIIESISNIKNSLIIVVANENKIIEEEKSIYLSFSEKVIQKIYNVDHYSHTAMKEILNNSIESIEIDKKLKQIISNSTFEIFNSDYVNNLRTLEKGLNFVKLLIKHINFSKLGLTDKQISQLITISLAIVIEDIEKRCSHKELKQKESVKKADISKSVLRESEKELPYDIIKNYLKENDLFSYKIILIEFVINIYYDLDLDRNFQKINNWYKDLQLIRTKKEDIDNFYLGEDKLRQRIQEFYSKYVLEKNDIIDVNNWFQKLNELCYYAEIIGIQNKFKYEEINEAIDNYLEKSEIMEDPRYLLRRNGLRKIKNEEMKKINEVLIFKIINKYYNSCIDNILEEIEKGRFEIEKLEKLNTLFDSNNFEGKNKIIERIAENSYFIPDLNYNLSKEEWNWTHSIWRMVQLYSEGNNIGLYNSFKKIVSELLKKSTKIGRYRIESLNSQYGIIL